LLKIEGRLEPIKAYLINSSLVEMIVNYFFSRNPRRALHLGIRHNLNGLLLLLVLYASLQMQHFSLKTNAWVGVLSYETTMVLSSFVLASG
jgi:hypothetical protein